MWLLMVVEIFILFLVLVFEFCFDNHRSKPVFMLDVGYYGNLILLDILILLKYHYYKNDEAAVGLLEEMITLVIYLMLMILTVKFVCESVPWGWLNKKLFDVEEDEGDEDDEDEEDDENDENDEG